MIRNILLFFAVVAFISGCTGKNIQKENTNISENEKKKLAIDYFIQGTVSDQKGEYEEAISFYEKALEYDPAPGVYFAIAKNYFLLNKLSLAKKNVEIALKEEPDNIEFNNLLANIYFSADKVDRAIETYDKIISLDSTNTDAYYNLGLLLENEQPYRAIDVYKNLIKYTGPEWNVILRLARVYEIIGADEETEKSIEELLKIDPSNLELKKLLVDLYIKNNNQEKALEILNDALNLFPEDLSLLEMKAQVLLSQSRWDEAASVYTKILQNAQVSNEIKTQVAAVFLSSAVQDSTVIKAANDLLENIDKDSTHWQIKLMHGEAKMLQGNDSAAIHYFKKALQIKNDNPETYIRLGGIYFDKQKYEEAEEILDSAVIKFSENFGINLILGLTSVQQNKNEKAEKYLKKAIEINSTDITALSAYGYTLNQLNRPKEAIKYISNALKIEPDNVELLTTLGLIYNAQKMWTESDEAYEKAIKIDSNNALALNNYAYSLSERSKDLDKALKMSKKAVDTDPENSSYLDTIGWIHYQLQEYKKAFDYISKANEIDKKNATILEHLGDVNFKLGNKNKAFELWQKAFELDPDNLELETKIKKGEL